MSDWIIMFKGPNFQCLLDVISVLWNGLKAGLKGLLRFLIMGMNGTRMGEVVRGCRFSLFSASKAWEAGECARAKPAAFRESSAESKQEQSEKQRQRCGRESRGSQFVPLCSKEVEIAVVLLSCQPCWLAEWQPGLPGATPVAATINPAWEKLLHHILHLWEGGRTDEQKSHSKSKTDVNPTDPLESGHFVWVISEILAFIIRLQGCFSFPLLAFHIAT